VGDPGRQADFSWGESMLSPHRREEWLWARRRWHLSIFPRSPV